MEPIDKGPIIVCGASRSGTTFMEEFLNTHEQIGLSPEMYQSILPHLEQWLKQIQNQRDAEKHLEEWATCNKPAIMRSLWYNGYKYYNRTPKKGVFKRYGNKTPWNELYFDLWEYIFEKAKPVYIYTFRDPEALLTSLYNMPWTQNHNESQFKMYRDRLIHSYKAVNDMKKLAPDRILIVNVCDLKQSEDERLKICDSIFKHIGEIPDENVIQFAKAWPSINSIKEKGNDLTKQKHLSNKFFDKIYSNFNFKNIYEEAGKF